MTVHRVLLLNASYEPLQFCTWKRAITLVLKGKAVAVETMEDWWLNAKIRMPLVVRMLYYIKIPYKTVPLNRRNLLHRDHNQCQYCGHKGDPLSIDHVMPRCRGGPTEWENVVTACHRCNVTKGNKTPEEAGMPLARKPFRPSHSTIFELSKFVVLARDSQPLHKYLYLT